MFGNLIVNGTSEQPGGKRVVLLNDMILQEGRAVPPVIVGQTEMLLVSKISEEEIELVWVDEHSNALDGRKLTIPIQMEPSVEFQLKGQPIGHGREGVRGVRVFPKERKAEAANGGDKVISLAEPIGPIPGSEDFPVDGKR